MASQAVWNILGKTLLLNVLLFDIYLTRSCCGQFFSTVSTRPNAACKVSSPEAPWISGAAWNVSDLRCARTDLVSPALSSECWTVGLWHPAFKELEERDVLFFFSGGGVTTWRGDPPWVFVSPVIPLLSIDEIKLLRIIKIINLYKFTVKKCLPIFNQTLRINILVTIYWRGC